MTDLLKPLRRLKAAIVQLSYLGTDRQCPVCTRSSSHFKPHGIPPRLDAACPKCGSFERHRLMWLFLDKKIDFRPGDDKKLLHIAPETCLEPLLRERLGPSYFTADLLNPKAMIQMDITDIRYPDEQFDAIICSHVLEHVAEDKKALKEFFRVLSPAGWALLMVPITAKTSFEDHSITDPGQRLKEFGQVDHVRRCGPDYVERIRDAGFDVSVVRPWDLLSAEEQERFGLANKPDELYFCVKPVTNQP